MSVRYDVFTETLLRTTNLPTITSFTMMGWFKISVDLNTFSTMLVFGATAGEPLYQIGTATDGTTLMSFSSGNSEVNGSALIVGTWYHVAITVAGTGTNQFLGYLNGVLNITNNGSTTATASKMLFGNNVGNEWLNGCIAAVKIYSAVLTSVEIANEMRQYVPIRTVNLNGFYPMSGAAVADFTVDYSGLSNTLTANGTLTREDGPPIPWRQGRRKIKKSITIVSFIAPRAIIINQSVNRASNY